MLENTAPKKAKKTHKLFVLKKNRKGQHFVETIARNKKIGYINESTERKQGCHRAIISLLKLAHEAYTAIDGDFSRIGELIDDRSGENSPITKGQKPSA